MLHGHTLNRGPVQDRMAMARALSEKVRRCMERVVRHTQRASGKRKRAE
jgi:hypothetical protein